MLVFGVRHQRHPASLFSVICNLLPLVVDHGKFPQVWIRMLHDLLDLSRLPSMVTSDQLGEFDLIVNRHGSPRDAEERLPLWTQVINDILDASVPDANHYYVLTMCYGA